MLKVETFAFNPFQENTYVVSDATRECVVVDPGCYDRQERDTLLAYLRKENLKPVMILNTHCHIDHVFGNASLRQTLGVPLLAHADDLYNLERAELFAKAMGLHFDPSPQPDRLLVAGETLRFGHTELEVIFAPGHSAGHVVFYCRATHTLLAGDVLFQGSIGRTDLPGGDFDTLMHSIVHTVLPLGDEVVVHPGHGPATTIGAERHSNPFILQYLAAH